MRKLVKFNDKKSQIKCLIAEKKSPQYSALDIKILINLFFLRGLL